MDDAERLIELEKRLADLKARMPKHTPRPSMMLDLEDLEEEIATLRKRTSTGGKDA